MSDIERNRDLLCEWRVYERFLCVYFNAVIHTTINSCRSTAAYIAAPTLEIKMRVWLIFFRSCKRIGEEKSM